MPQAGLTYTIYILFLTLSKVWALEEERKKAAAELKKKKKSQPDEL